jgi:hypothetical protein
VFGHDHRAEEIDERIDHLVAAVSSPTTRIAWCD